MREAQLTGLRPINRRHQQPIESKAAASRLYSSLKRLIAKIGYFDTT